jgi:PhzF family phenazine biosynthesis protein
MPIPLLQIDAFTDRPFAGNAAAVCLLPEARDEAWMQAVAAEMNLSETAFLLREEGEFRLRWFTPVCEVQLCGHATLASAHALWEWGTLRPEETARFRTRSGPLTCVRRSDWIEMDFPLHPSEPADMPPELAAGLGVQAVAVARSQANYLVELDSEATLRAVTPNFQELAKIDSLGIIITSGPDSQPLTPDTQPPTPPPDFVSRYFAPAAGIDEDPVTGSAHCTLGPYWQARLGKAELVGYQASRRGGTVRVTVREDRVLLAGQAVTVLRGELL